MSESKQVSVPANHSKPDKAKAPSGAAQAPAKSASNTPLVLALIALGFAIGLTATAYFTWTQLQQLIVQQAGVGAQVDGQIQPLRTSLEDIRQAHQYEREKIGRELARLLEEQQSTSHRVSVLAALLGRSEQGWSLAEVEYLLRIASQRLQLQRDLKTAEQALTSADGRLRELADPHYLSVREQIARDLEALADVPAVDVDGIALTLTAWLERIDELSVEGTRYRPAATGETDASTDKSSAAANWRELPAVVWASLSELFRLRDHDEPLGPMLPPEREYFLRENLRLQLSAARLAVLRDDAVQYRSALQVSRDWLKAYFAVEDLKVNELSKKLEELAAIDISPELPDISHSLQLLRQQMKLSEQQAVLPVVPAAQIPDAAPESEPVPEVNEATEASQP